MNEGFSHSETPAQRIASVRTFDELRSILYLLKSIPGSQKMYSGVELVDLIDKVRDGDMVIGDVPHTWGLRDKVTDLLVEENKAAEVIKNELDKIGGMSF